MATCCCVETTRECGNCATPLPVGSGKTCGKCLLVLYCGKECQSAHWKGGHKQVCVAPEARAPAAQAAIAPTPVGAQSCSICFEPSTDLFVCKKKKGHLYCTSCLFRAKEATCATCQHSLADAFGANFFILIRDNKLDECEQRLRELPLSAGLNDKDSRIWSSMLVGAYCNLGINLFQGEANPLRAIECFNKACKTDPTEPRCAFLEASAYKNANLIHLPEAFDAANRSICLNPWGPRENFHIYIEVCREQTCITREVKYIQDAECRLKQYLEKFPREGWAYFHLSLIYDTVQTIDQFKASCNSIMKALTYSPTDYNFFKHAVTMFQLLYAGLEESHRLDEFDVYRPFIAAMVPKAHKMDPRNFVASATFEQLMDKEFKWRPTPPPCPVKIVMEFPDSD
jgi:hypothetical protein